MGEQNFLNIEQIIPTKDSEEFMISIADKVREEIEGATEEKIAIRSAANSGLR